MTQNNGKSKKSLWRPVNRSRLYPMVPRATRKKWESSNDTASRLHAIYLRRRDEMLPAYFDKFDQYDCPQGLGAWARWYLLDVLLESLRQVKANGALIKKSAGLSRARQLWQILQLSRSVPMTPKTYYYNEMFRPEVRKRANELLHRHELKGVLYLLTTDQTSLAEVSPLTDKPAFAAKAAADGLPVTSTIAVLADGEVVQAPDDMPTTDLFLKPRGAKGGKGAQLWLYRAEDDSYIQSHSGETVGRTDLLDHLARQEGVDFLVQQRLVAHQDLADLTLDAVPTVRLITFTNEDGASELVAGALRMPAKEGAIVDNFHAGGIAARIDVDTGELGQAVSMKLDPAGKHDFHPVTGGAIAGRKLPLWEEVVEVTHRAHARFAPRVIIAWDICLTDDGPVLVEGNEQPGIELVQRLSGQPLGTSRFGELLAYHIDRYLATESSTD